MTTQKRTEERIKVLCVDDEPRVLEGMSLHLRRMCSVETATSGTAGLNVLERDNTFAVVISDMRMPGMNGAVFLSRSRALAPDAVRVLLTGQTDMNSAVQAVNVGQIFRFLTKPCPPMTLLVTIEAAALQHRLLTAERVLLEQTLHGTIKALTDILALANPVSFGRATRIKQLVTELAIETELGERWQVEVAAMLSQIGSMSLPPETLERVYANQLLSPEEEQMVARVPSVTEDLLRGIPRLDTVRRILSNYTKPFRLTESNSSDSQKILELRGASLLRIATDFDALTAQGHSLARTLDILRGRPGQYDPRLLVALDNVRGEGHRRQEVRELSLSALQVGMIFADDVRMLTGTLLVSRGCEVSAGFVERARNFRGTVREPIRILVRAREEPSLQETATQEEAAPV